MRHVKRFVHALLKAGLFAAYVWSATDEERVLFEAQMEEVGDDEDEDDETRERDAAYLTTGLITASHATAKAHDAGERCAPHHEATAVLLSNIEDSHTAFRIIEHLLTIVAESVDEDDIQRMVASIVTTELGEDHHHDH